MAQIEINSFITRAGLPATDIDDLNPHPDGNDYPRVRVWQIDGSVTTLVIGNPSNSDGIMVPVSDSIEDGFYTYIFTDSNGYDETQKYLIRVDGGPSLTDDERYQVSSIDPIENNIIAGVWDEDVASHTLVGSTGLALNQTKANTENLVVSVAAISELINLVLKYDTNRTKIDTTNHVMIIYDDDCVTELRRFQLLDSNGTPNSESVCERKPIAATDNKAVCP